MPSSKALKKDLEDLAFKIRAEEKKCFQVLRDIEPGDSIRIDPPSPVRRGPLREMLCNDSRDPSVTQVLQLWARLVDSLDAIRDHAQSCNASKKAATEESMQRVLSTLRMPGTMTDAFARVNVGRAGEEARRDFVAAHEQLAT
eukprot:809163-Rhodomonas_salina.5